MPTSSLKTSKSLVSESDAAGESSHGSRGDHNRRRGAGGETVNSSYYDYDEIPPLETVHEALSDLRLQIGDLSKAPKNMKEIIQKQEAQKEILGMPLLSPNYSQLGDVRERSELEEADLQPKRLQVRHFLDFADEEEHLRKRVAYQKDREVGTRAEISEEDILTTYKLSKRKENAFIKVTEHGNIRIFCGEADPEQMDRQ